MFLLVGISCMLTYTTRFRSVAGPVVVMLVVGVAGMGMVLVGGPTVSTPLAKFKVGVILVVALPLESIPFAALYCGGGMLMLMSLGLRVVDPAAATLVVMFIL